MPTTAEIRAQVAELGFAIQADCLRMRSLWWVDAIACRLTPHAGSQDAAADLYPDRRVGFTPGESGWALQVGDWGPAEGNGSWAIGASPGLQFRLADTIQQPLALHLNMHGVESPIRTAQEIGLIVDGVATMPLMFRPGDGWTDRVVCIGTRDAAHRTVHITFATSDLRTPRQLGLGLDDRPLIFTLRSLQLAAATQADCASRR